MTQPEFQPAPLLSTSVETWNNTQETLTTLSRESQPGATRTRSPKPWGLILSTPLGWKTALSEQDGGNSWVTLGKRHTCCLALEKGEVPAEE